MKRIFLAFSFAGLLLLGALIVGAGLGVAQNNQLVKEARPTATPDRPLPQPPVGEDEDTSPEIPPLPDLVVESIEVVPADPLIGEPVTVTVTIANQGSQDVQPGNNFWTDLYVDPAVVPIQLGQDGVVAWPCQSWWVPAGGSYTLETTRTFTFTDIKPYALYAQVDTDNHVAPEEREDNNILGPVYVEARAPRKLVHQTHQDFQMGLASNLDISHPEGVIRRGIFIEPFTEPGVYRPDVRINDITGTIEAGVLLTPTVRQVKPVLTSDGSGTLFAAWEDGRQGSVWHRRIYFSYSTDQGLTWSTDARIDPPLSVPDVGDYNQVSPDLAFDPDRGSNGRLYAVWQDGRNGDYDIYMAYSTDKGLNWTAPTNLIDEPAAADQMNPSIAVGPSGFVYVVWQDRRNGNDDVYLTRSEDGGDTWEENYFVTDDPQMTWQNQVAPSVGVDNETGEVFVAWEDWRNPAHPEIYVMRSGDKGQTFGIDVPVSIPWGTSYRVEPSLEVHTTLEVVEAITDPLTGISPTFALITAIHVVWQEGEGDNADVYYNYATINRREQTHLCPWPYEFCFSPPNSPQQVNGFVLDSEYVRPPDPGPIWPIEPSWQGQATLDLVPDFVYWTGCHADTTIVYSKGVMIAWSDARSYDDWRYEIRTRRVASPEGDPESFEVCEDRFVGVVNDNAKLFAFRDDADQYEVFKPAATRQSNPSILVDGSGIYVAWDDDRWDDPTVMGTVRNRDVFIAQMDAMGVVTEGIYISPVIDAHGFTPWYVLSWWGATEHAGDLLLQTRFGTTPNPPHSDIADKGWTRWTGNPSSPYLGCSAGEGCYYDAPGRHIVGPTGDEWPESRYIQYKVIIRGSDRLTALSQVTIHYGPYTAYLPLVFKQY